MVGDKEFVANIIILLRRQLPGCHLIRTHNLSMYESSTNIRSHRVDRAEQSRAQWLHPVNNRSHATTLLRDPTMGLSPDESDDSVLKQEAGSS